MNEAGTRAEHVGPVLKAAGWGVVEGSRVLREHSITRATVLPCKLSKGKDTISIVSGDAVFSCLARAVATLGGYPGKSDISLMLSPHVFSRSIALALVLAASLAACGSNRTKEEPAPLGETFGAEDTYSRIYAVEPSIACEATRRALLGQGYVIGKMAPEAVEATKNFQPESNLHTQLKVLTTCVSRSDGGSIVFINAVQDRYALKSQSNSASVDLSAIGSVSLPIPIGASNANLVRVGSNTVQNQDFYRRLFDRVTFYLPGTPANAPPPPEPEGPPDPVTPKQ